MNRSATAASTSASNVADSATATALSNAGITPGTNNGIGSMAIGSGSAANGNYANAIGTNAKANGVNDHDVANMGQLREIQNQSNTALAEFDKTNVRVNRAGALSAAMASLKPYYVDGTEKSK
jgi:trimeric autotransporter adhesin